MALTANAALFSWDDTIVPTLRKRLESESRLLAKRISAASIGSDDSHNPYHSPSRNNTRQNNASSPAYYHQQQRPSAIPRPSAQYSRPVEQNGHVQQPQLPYKRPRTLSQPFPFESPQTAMDSSASRSVSPQSSKPSRIPTKNRTESVSSNRLSNHTTTTTAHLNGRKSKDTYYAIDAIHEGLQNKPSAILHEQPPFPSHYADNDADSARLSSESDERPFEHWYRGEVSRNGGVGELRVARRKEMLDIASYGHSAKQTKWVADSHSRSGSKAGEFGDAPWQRRRTESIGATERESPYLDSRDVADEAIFDERPLTDVEDLDTEPEMRTNYHFPPRDPRSPHPPVSAGLDSVPRRSASSGDHVSSTTTASRIPTPSLNRQFPDPPRSPTPTDPPQVSRGSFEPMPSSPPPSSVQSQSNKTRARSQTPTRAPMGPQTPGPKTRNTARNLPSSSKQNGSAKKAKNPPSAMRRAKEEENNRRSVATYPTPDGEDMENAIPVWTQPVAGSNWDDVVLPVVARNKGLNEQYEMTDGSPKVVQTRDAVPEPAPGTFGYDHTKYKPPRTEYGETEQSIQMDEFGQHRRTEEHPEKQEIPPQSLRIEDRRPIQVSSIYRMSPPSSPVPFAHYGPKEDPVPYVKAHGQPSVANPQLGEKSEESDGAGCCKCVIM